jgi:hypothetical protein
LQRVLVQTGYVLRQNCVVSSGLKRRKPVENGASPLRKKEKSCKKKAYFSVFGLYSMAANSDKNQLFY